MSAKAFDDAWAQVQGDDAADPAMASLVRTALAKRIIETRGMASVVSPPSRNRYGQSWDILWSGRA